MEHPSQRREVGEPFFYCVQFGQQYCVDTELDTPRSSVFDHFLTNGLFAEKLIDFLRIAGQSKIDEDYFDAAKSSKLTVRLEKNLRCSQH